MGERMKTTSKKQFEWINFAKTLSMIAVVLDHTAGVAYKNGMIQYHTIFAVSLFIFLAGLTSSISIANSPKIDFWYTFNRMKKILIPYAIASLVYSVYFNRMSFNLKLFLSQLTSFSATAAFYFIFFYLQLILCSVFLFKLFNKVSKSLIMDIGLITIIYLLSVYFNRYTSMGMSYAGGDRLLGGNYFFVFCLGILFYKYMDILSNKKITILWLLLTLGTFWIFEKYKIIFRAWSNPPNKYAVLYMLLVFSGVFTVGNIVVLKNPLLKKLIRGINMIGKDSLYVFLYHPILIDIIKQYNFGLIGTPVFKIMLVVCSLIIPILCLEVWKKMVKTTETSFQ